MAIKDLKKAISRLEDDSPVTIEDQTATLEAQIRSLDDKLGEVTDQFNRAEIYLNKARALISLGRPDEAWDIAKSACEIFIANKDWENAADAFDVLFNTEKEGVLSVLGQGIWLAITFPMDLNLTLALLQHVVDETPDDYDGAAVAATIAVYLVELRGSEEDKKTLSFFANQLLGSVARRHSNIESQEQFDFWMEKLELNDPSKFLPRMRNVIDVLVQEDWWFDREAIQSELPDN